MDPVAEGSSLGPSDAESSANEPPSRSETPREELDADAPDANEAPTGGDGDGARPTSGGGDDAEAPPAATPPLGSPRTDEQEPPIDRCDEKGGRACEEDRPGGAGEADDEGNDDDVDGEGSSSLTRED